MGSSVIFSITHDLLPFRFIFLTSFCITMRLMYVFWDDWFIFLGRFLMLLLLWFSYFWLFFLKWCLRINMTTATDWTLWIRLLFLIYICCFLMFLVSYLWFSPCWKNALDFLICLHRCTITRYRWFKFLTKELSSTLWDIPSSVFLFNW